MELGGNEMHGGRVKGDNVGPAARTMSAHRLTSLPAVSVAPYVGNHHSTGRRTSRTTSMLGDIIRVADCLTQDQRGRLAKAAASILALRSSIQLSRDTSGPSVTCSVLLHPLRRIRRTYTARNCPGRSSRSTISNVTGSPCRRYCCPMTSRKCTKTRSVGLPGQINP